ncbi:MAG: glycosyltransferase [Phaeospirillum sp.]|nr:glycosyltransferase [Phaeospirillum sp.]
MKILLLARSMLRGGSERQLALLAIALTRRGHEVTAAFFYSDGPLAAELRQAGITVIDLAKRGRWDMAGFLWRLLRAVRRLRPDIIHGYLPVANLLALAARLAAPTARVVFGLRASDMRLEHYDRLSGLSYWLEARLARFAALLITNSQAGKDHAVRTGYPGDRIQVVANGIDTGRFRPDPRSRQAFRAELEIAAEERLIGMVARLDPMKDHETFLTAAARMATRRSDLRFVCIGDGPEENRAAIRDRTRALGLTGRFVLLAGRDDVQSVYPGLDLLISSSAFGEGFSNVLAEAMACGVPCVATQVGDAALILGETGTIVPARSPERLAEAAITLLDRPEAGTAARERIVEAFSVDRLAEATLAALTALSSPGANRR